MAAYPGPLRDEPLAIELHNTAYAADGAVVDGLADARAAAAWLDGLGARLPEGGSGRRRRPAHDELIALRAAIRDALQSVTTGEQVPRAALDAINAASARAPHSPVAVWRPHDAPTAAADVHGATRADVVLAALAADAIDLLTGPQRADLRACGAPGCVLLFLKDHPRREWCSNACGNRARQARHYRRSRTGS
ncbi:MAG TPA: ABATE domain-containing protein [Solirubrobacteraceae bacterium]|jgi:predicted RNA-binding Zn ribbon-like protein